MTLNDPQSDLPPENGSARQRTEAPESSVRQTTDADSDDSVTVVRPAVGRGQRSPGGRVVPSDGSSSGGESSIDSSSGDSHHDENDLTTTQHHTGENDDSDVTVVSRKPPHSVPGHAGSSRQLGELLIGKQLGTFRLERFLGSGGMGAVFQATDTQLNRQVAVKVLKNSDGDPDAIRRFRTEAQSAARLDHENIARVYHVGQDQGWNYIVLELVEGRTLRQLVIDSGPLSFPLALNYFRQLAAALKHAHHRKIIHRDIKPSNVLITPEQKIKIVDMGLARIVTTERQPDDTEDGMTLGTFDYIAPEQARDPRMADEQSDLYSLGCTLFFALTGKAPFAGGNAIEKILNHSNAARPNVCELRSDLPPEANLLVTRLMASNKLDRIQTADELEQALLYLQQPRYRQMERSPVNPVSPRVPMLMLITAAVVFFVSLLFDGPAVNSSISFPIIPGKQVAEPPAVSPDATTSETEIAAASENTSSSADNEAAGVPNVDDIESGIAESQPGGGNVPFLLQPKSLLDPPVRESTVNELTTLERWWKSGAFGEGWPNSTLQDWNTDPPQDLIGLSPPLLGPTTRILDPEGTNPSEGAVGTDRTARRNAESTYRNQRETLQVTTIQVRPNSASGTAPPEPLRPNSIRVARLEEAIRQLRFYSNVHTVELCFDGVVDCEPMLLPPGTLRTMKAGDGFRPRLRFQVLPRQSESSLLVIGGGDLTLSGIDVEVDARSADQPVAFLEFPKVNQLTVQDCAWTLRTDGNRQHEHVWIKANSTSVSVTPLQSQGTLNMSECTVRGNASVLNVVNFSPLGIDIRNCWIATPATAFVFQGLAPDSTPCHIELILLRSTFLAGNGLIRSIASDRRPHGRLLIKSIRSLLASLGDEALIQHYGQIQWENGEVPLFFEGNRNRFAAPQIWEIANDAKFLNRKYTLKQSIDQAWFQQLDYMDWQGMLVDGKDEPLELVFGSALPDWESLPNTLAKPDAGNDSVGADPRLLPSFPTTRGVDR